MRGQSNTPAGRSISGAFGIGTGVESPLTTLAILPRGYRPERRWAFPRKFKRLEGSMIMTPAPLPIDKRRSRMALLCAVRRLI